MTQANHPDVSIGKLLRTTFAKYHRLLVDQVHEAGFSDLTPAQAEVIALIDADPIKAIDLAARAEVSKQAMSLLTAELVRKDYLEQYADPQDGRAKLLKLSERGRHLKQAGQDAKTIAERKLLSKLDDRETQALIDYLLRALAD
ncbi:MarR family winged helix-turn-helix transcriptional regulator [Donghicola tyrosinivorans]|jgi:DNA-binding MarR family transcriptional regulator|uniref:DNA-binding MarR family transcriptional regulator n=1 Tax=Donghicola tyrosinivorans TaxID=1652492 RepID=A0A2T0W7V7_9RHOB|nr:MarR family transcriptional regulator [Donghicola tyrosinivorans]PRY82785.1 DNA-binding MarR family transcriptional regulator [Donghicola tyrosinivorans]